MIRLCFFLLSVCCWINTLPAQSVSAREMIDTLCSPYFFGRGYVREGQPRAAQYLEREMARSGVQPLFPGNSYLQPFRHTVNTFPKEQRVHSGRPLNPGTEFMVHPGSGSGKGKYRLVHYRRLKEARGKVAVWVPDSAAAALQKMGKLNTLLEGWTQTRPVVLGQAKLTWGVSNKAFDHPVVLVIDSLVNPDEKIALRIRNQLREHTSSNVMGYVLGKMYPDSFLLVTAHYDHIGGMGDVFIPGANDNAAGVAMLMEIAQHYAENPHPFTVVFVAFAGEEAGLLGSAYYVQDQPVPLEQTAFVFNLDLVGTGSEGATVVNATIFEDAFHHLDSLNRGMGALMPLKKRGKAANSDHYWFTERGIPSFFLYTMGGPQAYHDVNDRPETLPLTRFDQVKGLVIAFLDQLYARATHTHSHPHR